MIYKNICLLGDSITKGIGVPDERYSWSNSVSDYFNEINVINHGKGGLTSSDALNRMDDVLKDSPDITTIQFGMNDHCIDQNGSFTVEKSIFGENLTTIIEHLYKRNSKVILMTNHSVIEGNEKQYYYSRHPQNAYQRYGGVNSVIEQYNEIVRDVSNKYNTELLDMHAICNNYDKYKFLRSLENSNRDDGVHPHILGSRIYAREIIKIINRITAN